MNQFYNTRNPADLWLNVGDFWKVLIICVTPWTISLITAWRGLKYVNQKRALLHFVNFLHQSLMLADRSRCFPRRRPPDSINYSYAGSNSKILVCGIPLFSSQFRQLNSFQGKRFSYSVLLSCPNFSSWLLSKVLALQQIQCNSNKVIFSHQWILQNVF